MKINLLAILLVMAVVFIAGCAQSPPKATPTPTAVAATPTPSPAVTEAPPVSPTAPQISFTFPTEGSIVSGPDVTFQFSVSNFQIVAPSDKNEEGKGHLHGYLDDGQYIPIAQNSYTAKGLSAGKHKFRLELQNIDHSLVSPKVMKEVSFTVGATKVFTVDITHDGGYAATKDSTGATVTEIKVNSGDTVKILGTTSNPSHNHGITIDALNVNVEIKALAGTTPQEVTFTAPIPGTYQIYCKTCLGGALGAHPGHKINLVVQ